MAAARSPEPSADYYLPFGKARVVKEGTDVYIITYGMMVYKALNAAAKLEKEEGVSVEIIDLRTIVHRDTEAILAAIEKTNLPLVLYSDHEFAGFGAEISAQMVDNPCHQL